MEPKRIYILLRQGGLTDEVADVEGLVAGPEGVVDVGVPPVVGAHDVVRRRRQIDREAGEHGDHQEPRHCGRGRPQHQGEGRGCARRIEATRRNSKLERCACAGRRGREETAAAPMILLVSGSSSSMFCCGLWPTYFAGTPRDFSRFGGN
jgi:hypothetical protein